jgi:hypothetical protein
MVNTQIRPATKELTVQKVLPTSPLPVWLKLTRVGDQVSAAHSADGSAWKSIAWPAAPPSFPPTVFVGFAFCSHQDIPLSATFDQVKLTAQGIPVQAGAVLSFEAEKLAANGSCKLQTTLDEKASGGNWCGLQANGPNDYVDFTIPNIPKGTYKITLSVKMHQKRGQLTATLDGAPIGGAMDQYSKTIGFQDVELGTKTFDATGNHVIRLTVTGKTAESLAYIISVDTFKFIPQ